MILEDVSPLVDSIMVGRVLLDPKVQLLLNEQPPLDLVEILSLHEASELLSRKSHGPAETDTLMSMGKSHRVIVLEASFFLGYLG